MFSKTDIEKYFSAEKSESLLFMVVGIAAIIAAIVFFFYLKSNWYKGAAIPFVVVGLLHLIIGFTIYNRSDEDRKRVVYAYSMDPGAIRTKEIPRMEIVNKNFVVYRYAEIALLIIGVVLFFFFRHQPEKSFWVGLGVALAVEAAISLGADYFAEQRGKIYLEGLNGFVEGK
ncbi:MAG: hypothetical protein ACOYKE_05885 [Ferruginibacter sp.]